MEKIIKQGSLLVFAQVLARTVSFFYTIFLARSLGVEDFGLYSVALAYFALVSTIADFGFSRLLIRELSKDINKASQLLLNMILLRLSLASILFAVLGLILYSVDSDKTRVSLTMLAIMAVLPQTIASVLDGVFVALRKLKYSAIALFLHSLVIVLIGFILVQSSYGAIGAIVALIVGQVSLALLLWIFLFRFKISFSFKHEKEIKGILIGSLPYGLLGILGFLYFRIDTLILSYLKGSFETGLYSAAYKFLDALIFVPSALSTALFPVLAKLHDNDPAQVKKLYFKSLKFFISLGLFLMAGYIFLLPLVIKFLLPNYIQSINVVLILSLSIPFIFAHAPAIQVLFSSDKYLKHVILFSVFTLMFNVLANLVFIPIYGLYAAAFITTISEALSFIIFFLLLKFKVFR